MSPSYGRTVQPLGNVGGTEREGPEDRHSRNSDTLQTVSNHFAKKPDASPLFTNAGSPHWTN